MKSFILSAVVLVSLSASVSAQSGCANGSCAAPSRVATAPQAVYQAAPAVSVRSFSVTPQRYFAAPRRRGLFARLFAR